MLSRLNYIFATDRDRIENAIDTLCAALSGCAEWAREHSHYLQLALEWDRAGSPSRLLLQEDQLAHAVKWLASRPEEMPPSSEIVQNFIAKSQILSGFVKSYNREKLKAISGKLDPLLRAHIEAVRKSLNFFPPPHIAPGAGLNQWDEVATLENFIADKSRLRTH